MSSYYWWMLLGMSIVTYIPRAFPLTFLEGRQLPKAVRGVLQNIPFAVLGALIFPGILLIKEGDILYGLIGAVAAFVLAILGANVMVVVMGAIAVLAVVSFL